MHRNKISAPKLLQIIVLQESTMVSFIVFSWSKL